MTTNYTPKSDNLDALLSTNGSLAASADTAGKTLTIATYFVPLGMSEAELPGATWLVGIGVKWNAALAATITVEGCNYPSTIEGVGRGRADVTDYEATGVSWIQENPSSAVVYSAGGAGNTVTAQTIVAGGTAAGGVNIYLANAALRRYRLKVVVTVGGTLRVGVNGKD